MRVTVFSQGSIPDVMACAMRGLPETRTVGAVQRADVGQSRAAVTDSARGVTKTQRAGQRRI